MELDAAVNSQISGRLELINYILLNSPVDIWALRILAREEEGYITNALRARVWPKLLNINRYAIPDYKHFVHHHRDQEQVKCDIDRSLWNLDCVKHWDEAKRNRRRQALNDIIIAILCRNPQFHYFQGLHDIISAVMLVINDDILTFGIAEALCQRFLSDFLRRDFEVVSRVMHLIVTIIQQVDPPLAAFFHASHTEPYFATAWFITWLAHDIKVLHEIARIFDVMLCSHPLYCLYICTALVLEHHDEIMSLECEFSAVHNYLVKLPQSQDIHFEVLLKRADALIERIPPQQLLQLSSDARVKSVLSNQKYNALQIFLTNISRVALFHAPKVDDTLSLTCDWELLQKRHLQRTSSSVFQIASENAECIVGYIGWVMQYPVTEQQQTNSETLSDKHPLLPSGIGDENHHAGDNRVRKLVFTQNDGICYALAALGGALSIGMYFLYDKS